MDKIEKRLSIYKLFVKNYQLAHFMNDAMTLILHMIYYQYSINANQIEKAWKDFLKLDKNKCVLNFYIHIPYCFKKCSYCNCSSYELKNNKELRVYIDNLINYLDYFKNIFSKASFTNLFVGGGTPSILSERMLEEVFSKLFSNFNFDEDGEKTCELNPVSSSLGKLKVLRKYKFNKIRFGIQSFDRMVLRYNNRAYQTHFLVKKAVQDAKKVGFKNISLDLIMGLYGQNNESVINDFKKTINLRPCDICLYPYQPTEQYLKKYFQEDIDFFYEYRRKLIHNSINQIIQIAKNKHYFVKPDINSINFDMNDPSSINFRSREIKAENNFDKYYAFDSLERTSILGIGQHAISYIYKRMNYQAEKELSPDPEKYLYEGIIFNKRLEMLKYITIVLSARKFISRKDFKNTFSKDILIEFKEAIEMLKKLKLISIKGDKINYLLDSPAERFLYIFFFFDLNDILSRMNRSLCDNFGEFNLANVSLPFKIEYSDKKRKLDFCHSKIYSLVLLSLEKVKLTKKEIIFVNKLKNIFRSVSNQNLTVQEIKEAFLKKSNKKIKKMNIKRKENKNFKFKNMIDGSFMERDKNLILMKPKNSNKKIKINILPKTSFLKANFSILNNNKYKQISEEKIKLKDFNKGDDISVFVYKKDNKIKASIVKQIVVN